MKQFEVRFSASAEADLDRIWRYIAQRFSVDSADRFLQDLRIDCIDIGRAPFQGAVRQDGVRKIGIAKGPAALSYRIKDDVEILAVHYRGRIH